MDTNIKSILIISETFPDGKVKISRTYKNIDIHTGFGMLEDLRLDLSKRYMIETKKTKLKKIIED